MDKALGLDSLHFGDPLPIVRTEENDIKIDTTLDSLITQGIVTGKSRPGYLAVHTNGGLSRENWLVDHITEEIKCKRLVAKSDLEKNIGHILGTFKVNRIISD